ncbi:MAG: alpha/beta hydrolase-fold protein [Gemmatimonadota bacterium]|nr:alpha/beta hydrolase-fold protein [Gemmatimonadota bacterium]
MAPWSVRIRPLAALATLAVLHAAACAPEGRRGGLEITVRVPAERDTAFDGRLVLVLSADTTAGAPEPRFQLRSEPHRSAQAFGLDVEGWPAGAPAVFDGTIYGFPRESLDDLPAGAYRVQAVLNRYEHFDLATGHRVLLPPDRGEGQQWNRKPGNLYSEPAVVRIDPARGGRIDLVLDREVEPIEPPADTKYIRHVRMRSELLSEFWGRDVELGAHVLVPEGFEDHPEARYPLMIFHGHFPADFGGFRTVPPDPDLPCEHSERFDLDCYNRIQQQEAYDFYRLWTSEGFPRFLVVEIQHPTPYYDDSYAVNSASQGPWGDAITHELVPFLEARFRGLGEGWARFLYGGSTGGWEAAAAQVFYPDEYNGAFAACPDPIDFRAYELVNIYEHDNAYFDEGPFGRVARPAHRDWLGRIAYTVRDENHLELVLGTRGRSGGQWDIWEATYSPQAPDGYPARIWDKRTGRIDREVAKYWRENYDLRHILERDWETLGPKLAGKLHIFVGDMDNYYLNNAVYLAEAFLESTTDPYYDGVVDYGDRAEHCWNGDHANPNAISRLRYNTMYLNRILERIREAAPPGADTTSWRY